MKTTITITTLLLLSTTLSFSQDTGNGSGKQAATTSKATTTSTSASPTVDKVQDLEMRLLIQKIATKELQFQQLSQSLTTDRQTLNSMVTAACKSKGIEMPNCTVKMESDKSGGEYLTFSKTVEEEKVAKVAPVKGDK